jgi:hypothetical protein
MSASAIRATGNSVSSARAHMGQVTGNRTPGSSHTPSFPLLLFNIGTGGDDSERRSKGSNACALPMPCETSWHLPGAPGHSAESHRLHAQASHRPPVLHQCRLSPTAQCSPQPLMHDGSAIKLGDPQCDDAQPPGDPLKAPRAYPCAPRCNAGSSDAPPVTASRPPPRTAAQTALSCADRSEW